MKNDTDDRDDQADEGILTFDVPDEAIGSSCQLRRVGTHYLDQHFAAQLLLTSLGVRLTWRCWRRCAALRRA